MYDVFVSYTTRGATTDEWVIKFAEDLEKYFFLTFSRKLSVWYALEKIRLSNNYRVKINEAINDTPVFIMILDSFYINENAETQAEIDEYKRVREEMGQPLYFLKVIKYRGAQEDELVSFIDSEIVLTYLTKRNDDGTEPAYKGDEYIEQIQRIVMGIREGQIEKSRKLSSQVLLNYIKELQGIPKIFVALGNTGSVDRRRVFINQLSKTITRNPNLENAKIFPDDLTVSLLKYGDLEDLLYEDNPYGKACMNAMLEASSAAVLPLMTDNKNEVVGLFKKIRFQFEAIKKAAQTKQMLLHIFLALPKDAQNLFKDEIDNPVFPSYKNIKIFRDVDINFFIESYIADIESILGVHPPAVAAARKYIYVIEDYKPEVNAEPGEDLKNKLALEKENKQKLREYLVEKNFELLPYLAKDADFKKTVQFHRSSLDKSDGVIIYTGLQEDLQRCRDMQYDIFSIILDVNEAKKKDIKKAVYVDPLQEERDAAKYTRYGYDVILNTPKELEAFICKI